MLLCIYTSGLALKSWFYNSHQRHAGRHQIRSSWLHETGPAEKTPFVLPLAVGGSLVSFFTWRETDPHLSHRRKLRMIAARASAQSLTPVVTAGVKRRAYVKVHNLTPAVHKLSLNVFSHDSTTGWPRTEGIKVQENACMNTCRRAVASLHVCKYAYTSVCLFCSLPI